MILCYHLVTFIERRPKLGKAKSSGIERIQQDPISQLKSRIHLENVADVFNKQRQAQYSLSIHWEGNLGI